MSERKLASIQRIVSIEPIQGADKIELATVLGWQCVVKKDEFKIGDLCVYIEIDSIVPADNPYFEFLKDRKYRVRTIRLRGQISQGLVCPLNIMGLKTSKWDENRFQCVPQILEQIKSKKIRINEGSDVTDILKITKYDPELKAEMQGTPKKKKSAFHRFMLRFFWYRKVFGNSRERFNWPDWIYKTDENRLQCVPQILEQIKSKKIRITEKLDGSSISVYLYKGKFGVCSRNLGISPKDQYNARYWKTVNDNNIEEKLKRLSEHFDLKNIALQAEMCGPGVQGNKYKLNSLELFVFNLFDIDAKKYIHFDSNLLLQFGFKHVPILYEGLTEDLGFDTTNIQEWVKFATHKSQITLSVLNEGIVVRPAEDMVSKVSFKVINPEFLLKFADMDEKIQKDFKIIMKDGEK